MSDQPIFSAPTREPGEVRVYRNRVEIDRRGLLGTTTRTVFLWNIAQLWYSGGVGFDLVAPNNTSVGVILKRKEDARALVDALKLMVGRE